MDLFTVKVISFVAILIVAIVGGVIPLLSSKVTNSERFISLGNAFAGGLFLGVGFIHLLPEGIEAFTGYTNFPWGTLIATTGFAVFLLIDRVLFPDDQASDALRRRGTEKIYPYVLLAMLSIHSVVEGIALGLEEKIAGAMAIFIGILFHKGSVAFAFILSTNTAGIERKQQKYFLAIFSVMAPLGILLGTSSGFVFAATSGVYGVLQGVFNAFAAGTFIYIAVIDIIDKELTTHKLQMARCAANAVTSADDIPMPTQPDDRYLKFLLIMAAIVLVAFSTEWAHVPHN